VPEKAFNLKMRFAPYLTENFQSALAPSLLQETLQDKDIARLMVILTTFHPRFHAVTVAFLREADLRITRPSAHQE
jgi:hypothetical protein